MVRSPGLHPWAKAGTAFDAIEENIRNANNEQQKFNNSIRGGNNSANGLLSTIKKVAIAAGGIAGINKVLNISDELASTKARLNLLVDDGGSVEALEQRIMASAQCSRSAYFDTASAVAKLGLNAGNAFGGNIPEIERRVREALLQDDRITAVQNFEFTVNKKKVLTTFTVVSIFGEINAELGVEI